MAEDKKNKIEEELQDEQLDEVSGGSVDKTQAARIPW